MIELEAGSNRVLLDPARGGRLASWLVDGRELLVGPPSDDDRSIHWGCFLMAPWPGRLAGGRFTWHGREVQLQRTHGRHAIHGVTWNRAWTVDAAGPETAMLSIELPRDAWPMGGWVRQRVAVGPDGIRLEAEIEAVEAMPAALGWHPWFLRRGDPRVRVDAASYQLVEGMIPTGASAAVAGRTDLRSGPRLGSRRLDLAYLEADSPAVIMWPDLELRIEFEPAPAPLVVYTPRDSFCVEPLTAPPNAFALPSGLRKAAGVPDLAGGERFAASMTMTLRAPGPRAPGPVADGQRV